MLIAPYASFLGPTFQSLGIKGDGSDETAALQAIFTSGLCPITYTPLDITVTDQLWIFKINSGMVGPVNGQAYRWNATPFPPKRALLRIIYNGPDLSAGEYILNIAGNSPYGNSGLGDGSGNWALESIALLNCSVVTATNAKAANGIGFFGGSTSPVSRTGGAITNIGYLRNVLTVNLGLDGPTGIGQLVSGGAFDITMYNPVSLVAGTSSAFKLSDGGDSSQITLYNAYATGLGVGFSNIYNCKIFGAKSQSVSGYDCQGYNALYGLEHETASGSITSGSYGVKVSSAGPNIVQANSLSWIDNGILIGNGDSANVVGYDITVAQVQNANNPINVTTGAAARRGIIRLGAIGPGVANPIVNSAEQGDVNITLSGLPLYSAQSSFQLTQDINPQVIGAAGTIIAATPVTLISSAGDVVCATPAIASPGTPNYYCPKVTLFNSGSHNITIPNGSGVANIGGTSVVLAPSTTVSYLWIGTWYQQ